MNWDNIKNANNLIQIPVGFIIIGSTIGISREIIINGLNSQVPIWIAGIIMLVFLVTGFLLGNRLNKIKKEKKKPYELSLPLNELPEKSGWKLSPDDKKNDSPTLPIIKVGSDGLYGKYWQIERIDRYYLDYHFHIIYKQKNKLAFTIQFVNNFVIYAEVKLIRGRNNDEKLGWLAFIEGKKEPKPLEEGIWEWTIHSQPKTIVNEWKGFEINLIDAVNQSFGTEGWKYSHVTRIRIRESLKIARIAIY
jgi:hypothetical protein